jgi:hypothetical protein
VSTWLDPQISIRYEPCSAGFFKSTPRTAEFGLAPPAEQAIELVFYDPVTLTYSRLQPIAIQNVDAAAAIANQTGVLQVSRSYGDALTASPKHIGYQVLGHEKVETLFPVLTQEQPTAESLLHGMQTVADRGLRNLRDECLCISKQQMLKWPWVSEFFL